MPVRVTVVIAPNAASSRGLLASVDRQSLPAADLEVLVGDDEQSPELTSLLDDLAAHRTNLTRVPVPAGTDPAEALLARASGEYVVALRPKRTLTDDALERLADRADASAADVCRGLTGRAGVRPARLAAPGELPGPAGALRRRAGLTADVLAADLAGDDAPDDGATAVVADALCFLDGGKAGGRPAETAGDAQALAQRVSWRDGVLEVVADLTEPAVEVTASVFHPATGVEWQLTDASVAGGQVTFRLDPEDVAGRGPLPDGLWWPSLRLGTDRVLLVSASEQVAHGGTLRGRTVVSHAREQRLAVDVGGGGRQPIRRLDPAATTVVEDSRGSLLTSPVANIDLAPGQRVTGELRLGKMPVVAWLEHLNGTGPVLRAWVSGLAGESTLETRFSSAPFAPTGTQLEIDGVGAMKVAPAAHQPPAAPASRNPVIRARRLAGRVKRAIRG